MLFEESVLIGCLLAYPRRCQKGAGGVWYYQEELNPDLLEYQSWKSRCWRALNPEPPTPVLRKDQFIFLIPARLLGLLEPHNLSEGRSAHLLPLALSNDVVLATWFMEASYKVDSSLYLPLPQDWVTQAKIAENFTTKLGATLIKLEDGSTCLKFSGPAINEIKRLIYPHVIPTQRSKFGEHLITDMPDVSSTSSQHLVKIQKVGIRQVPISYNVRLRHNVMPTIARASVYTDLQPEVTGSHLSRLIESLNLLASCPADTDLSMMELALQDLKDRLRASDAYLKLRFPILLDKPAPVSGILSSVRYDCTIYGELVNGQLFIYKKIKVPYLSACICSKSISAFNAHCQRSFAEPCVLLGDTDVSFESLIEIVESVASAPIRTLLKREDEKYITEAAYDNATFVEIMARKIALKLELLPIRGYSVLCEHEESLHQHNAVAVVRGGDYYVY